MILDIVCVPKNPLFICASFKIVGLYGGGEIVVVVST